MPAPFEIRQALTALGIQPGAEWEVIRSAHRRLVKLYHPDVGGDPAMFRRVQSAYEILRLTTMTTTRSAPKPKAPPKAAPTPRQAKSKKAIVLELLQRKRGATLDQIMKATGWQAHTVRAFVVTVPRWQGLTVTSTKVKGQRTYSARK